jgi:hypothetical protein
MPAGEESREAQISAVPALDEAPVIGWIIRSGSPRVVARTDMEAPPGRGVPRLWDGAAAFEC